MYGSGMGSLNIYVESSQGRKLLLSRVGDQGQSWHTVHVDLQSSRDYNVREFSNQTGGSPVENCEYLMLYLLQVIIEGVRGGTFRSDVAIDDIVFIQGSCGDTPCKSLFNDQRYLR
jgi:hypothetical protein